MSSNTTISIQSLPNEVLLKIISYLPAHTAGLCICPHDIIYSVDSGPCPDCPWPSELRLEDDPPGTEFWTPQLATALLMPLALSNKRFYGVLTPTLEKLLFAGVTRYDLFTLKNSRVISSNYQYVLPYKLGRRLPWSTTPRRPQLEVSVIEYNAIYANIVFLRRLLAAGVPVTGPHREKSKCINALSAAGLMNNLEVMNILLDAGADPNDTADPQLSLHYAAAEGHAACAELLLDRGAKVNSTHHPEGLSALHIAVKRSDHALATLLIDRGANPNLASRAGDTPLHVAVSGTCKSSHTPVSIEMMQLLLACGADPGAHNMQGRPPLHAALMPAGPGMARDVDAVQALLSGDDALRRADRGGNTTLHYLAAAAQPDLAALAALLKRGAPVAAVNAAGATALVAAVRGMGDDRPISEDEGAAAAVRLLLAAGADPNAAACFGAPLLVAMRSAYLYSRGLAHTALALLDAGASVHARHPVTGDTALHVVLRAQAYGFARLLLGRGADPCARNNEGVRAQDCAESKMIKILSVNSVVCTMKWDLSLSAFDRWRSERLLKSLEGMISTSGI